MTQKKQSKQNKTKEKKTKREVTKRDETGYNFDKRGKSQNEQQNIVSFAWGPLMCAYVCLCVCVSTNN